MTSALPNTLTDIITKVRRITGRQSAAEMSDDTIIQYINTFYVYDMPDHIKMESLRYNFQFTTQANIPVYDMPTDTWIGNMPPVYIAGYESYMTQSRQNFFRTNSEIQLLQQQVYTGVGTETPYTGQFLTSTPIIPGFKPNPPGAYSTSPVQVQSLNWNVLISGQLNPSGASGVQPWATLVDDGQGNLVNPQDQYGQPGNGQPAPLVWGSVNYLTGALSITNFPDPTNPAVPIAIPQGNPINAQYAPYVASRPLSVVFFQDQFQLYPIPDQPYTVSFEAYKYPIQLNNGDFPGLVNMVPQVKEWWQLLAYGAADKIFSDFGDMENMQKYRPLLDEQQRLMLRRTLIQQASQRTMTIYSEQNETNQYPFGNLFPGF